MAITIGPQGKLSLPPKVARELGGQILDPVSSSARHLLLTARGSDGEVVLAGQLGEFSVTDLLSLLNMFRKTGILRFQLAGGDKAIYFQQGEVVFASSTFPDEDLGEVLLELGKVDREMLSRARQLASSHTTVGKILVEKQAVSPKDLWAASRSQVEAIVFNLFGYEVGSFSFLSKPLDTEQIIRLSMGTQNLILEGLRRVDERGLFMRAIGSLDHRVVVVEPTPDDLPRPERDLMTSLEGQDLLVRDALRRTGYTEFDGLRLLYRLHERKLVRFDVVAEEAVTGQSGEIMQVFNGALKVLYAQVSAREPSFGEEIRYFLRDLPQPFSFVFRDITPRNDGSLDGARILLNLAGLDQGDQQRLLVDALNELVYMECLVARRVLGAEQSTPLLQRVQDIARRVKELIGRET